MRPTAPNAVCLAYGVLVIALAGPLATRGSENLPEAATVINRLIQRANDLAQKGRRQRYVYHKRSVVEELDSAGKASERTEKLYQVVLIKGVPFSRLIKIQNRDLTPAELEKEERREEAFRKKVMGRGEKAQTGGGQQIAELAAHYELKVERRENLEHRATLVLSFRPKADRVIEKTIQDKVLNRLAGTVWVDEEESEVARLKVGLTEAISLGWFGMIGSLRECDLSLENERVEEGVWLKAKQTIFIGGRKVLAAMHYRATEEAYDFTKP